MGSNWKEQLRKLDKTGFAVTGTSSSIANLKPSHVEGARDPRKVTIKALYAYGEVSVAQAIAFGAGPKEHVTALDNCKNDAEFMALVEEMVTAGVDMLEVERVRNRMLKRLGVDVKRADYDVTKQKGQTTVTGQNGTTMSLIEAQARAALNAKTLAGTQRPVVVVRKENVMLAKVKPRTLTQTQVEVAAALVKAEEREKLLKQLAALKKEREHLDRVSSLSDEEKAELLTRHQQKDAKVTIK